MYNQESKVDRKHICAKFKPRMGGRGGEEGCGERLCGSMGQMHKKHDHIPITKLCILSCLLPRCTV